MFYCPLSPLNSSGKVTPIPIHHILLPRIPRFKLVLKTTDLDVMISRVPENKPVVVEQAKSLLHKLVVPHTLPESQSCIYG